VEELTSRERVLLALNHEEADRVPIELGGGVSNFHADMYERLGKHLGLEYWKQWISNWGAFKVDERLLKRLHVDVRHLWFNGGGTKNWTPVKINSDGTFTDFWGIRYRVLDDVYSTMVEHPLAKARTPRDVEEYYASLPDPKAVGAAAAEGLAEEAASLAKEKMYAIKGEPMWSHFELCQWLRGMEDFFVDMARGGEMAYSQFQGLFDYQSAMFEEYFRAVGKYLDLVWVSDDFGAQGGLLIGKDMLVKQVKPWQAKRIAYVRERAPQAKIFLHSCGSVYDFLPDLIDIGLEGLNPLQPFACRMEPERLKQDFGEKLLFMGGLDHQFVLSQPPDEVIRFVDRLLEAYAPGGGYIFSTTHVMPGNARLDSIVAAFDHVVEAGTYAGDR
jgi:uroporphyrinogen decarboxylase